VERVPCLVEPLDSRQAYLLTKRDRMGHLLEGL
jgi:GTP cyclohydrolase II